MADFTFSGDRTGDRMDDLLTVRQNYLIGQYSPGYEISGSSEEWITEEISLEENSYYTINGILRASFVSTGSACVIDGTVSGISESFLISSAHPGGDARNNSSLSGNVSLGTVSASNSAFSFFGALRTGSSPTIRFSYDPSTFAGDMFLQNLFIEFRNAVDTYQLP